MSRTRQSAAAPASSAASPEANETAVKPPACKIRSSAWPMVASSSTTTMIGGSFGISNRPNGGSVRRPTRVGDRKIEESINAGWGRRYCPLGQSRLPFGTMDGRPCKDAGVRGGSDSRGGKVWREPVGNVDQFRQRGELQVRHAPRPVGCNRALRGAEFRGNLLVGLARRHPGEDRAFPGGQGRKARPPGALPCSVLAALLVPRQGIPDGLQEHRPLHRFG